jgi:hypothetical protein
MNRTVPGFTNPLVSEACLSMSPLTLDASFDELPRGTQELIGQFPAHGGRCPPGVSVGCGRQELAWAGPAEGE